MRNSVFPMYIIFTRPYKPVWTVPHIPRLEQTISKNPMPTLQRHCVFSTTFNQSMPLKEITVITVNIKVT